jgi:hypothetical protein
VHIDEYIAFFGQRRQQNSIRFPFIEDKRILVQSEHKLQNVLVMYSCIGRVADHISEMASVDRWMTRVCNRIKFDSE